MPVENHEELKSILIKVGIYVGGILLGLAAKLAAINKEKPLTVRDFIAHSSVAFACAWLVLAILAHYNHLDFANIISVIVGRYGNHLLFAIWKAIKNAITEKIK